MQASPPIPQVMPFSTIPAGEGPGQGARKSFEGFSAATSCRASQCAAAVPKSLAPPPKGLVRYRRKRTPKALVLGNGDLEHGKVDEGALVLGNDDLEHGRVNEGALVLRNGDLEHEKRVKGALVLRNGDLEHGRVDEGASVLRNSDSEHGRVDEGA